MGNPIDQKDRVREMYFNNPSMTLKEAADEYGVPYDTAKMWSKDEGWRVKRIIGGQLSGLSETVETQAEGIRLVLFEEILTGMHDAKDLNELVKAWKSLVTIGEREQEDSEYIDRDELAEMIGASD